MSLTASQGHKDDEGRPHHQADDDQPRRRVGDADAGPKRLTSFGIWKTDSLVGLYRLCGHDLIPCFCESGDIWPGNKRPTADSDFGAPFYQRACDRGSQTRACQWQKSENRSRFGPPTTIFYQSGSDGLRILAGKIQAIFNTAPRLDIHRHQLHWLLYRSMQVVGCQEYCAAKSGHLQSRGFRHPEQMKGSLFGAESLAIHVVPPSEYGVKIGDAIAERSSTAQVRIGTKNALCGSRQ
jgi:hypothetical protein